MKRVVVLIFALSGCAQPIAYQPVEVKVPVLTPCTTDAVKPPVWVLDRTPLQAPLFDKVKNALAEIELHKAYEAKLQATLAACR